MCEVAVDRVACASERDCVYHLYVYGNPVGAPHVFRLHTYCILALLDMHIPALHVYAY
jgi:hypothetical protein